MVPVCKTGAAMGHRVVLALMWSAGENVTVGYILVPHTNSYFLITCLGRNLAVQSVHNLPPSLLSLAHFPCHLPHCSSNPLPTALDKVFAVTLSPACLLLMVQ